MDRNRALAALRQQAKETTALAKIAENISASLLFEDILENVYKSFRGLLPYDRIGLAVVAGAGREVLSIGARSNARTLHLPPGYRAPLRGSSLERILKTGKPRIINDLRDYLLEHPKSDSTRKIVAEGIRSSLTCPLVASGKPVGFIFFSSRKPGTYERAHIRSYQRVATMLSLAVEKGRLYEGALDANKIKNKMLSIATHDLRNPLAVMIGYLSFLEKDPAGSACRPELAIIQRKCKQMITIIDSLLDFSILESKGLELRLQSVDLGELLGHICADNRILANNKSITLGLRLAPNMPAVTADRFQLQQAFDNLVSNAIKYSPTGKSIDISTRATTQAVEVSVADEGQGIPPEEISLLFREFGRAKIRPTAGERSVGLGLSIAHRIVQAHGGSIRVASRPGAGATFTVSLPLRRKENGTAVLDLR